MAAAMVTFFIAYFPFAVPYAHACVTRPRRGGGILAWWG
jgi:hypothetical protein